MKTMKFNLPILLAIIFLIATACNKDDDLNNNGQTDYNEFCGDLDGGSFNITIEGQNWSTNCVQAVYSESISTDFEQKFLYIYGYNYDGTYFSDTDIELAYILWNEITSDGQTESSATAVFYKGFYDYSQVANDPNYEAENVKIYLSEGDSSDELNITNLTSSMVSGNLNFKLFGEETNEEVTMSGSFEANIVQ